MRQVFVHACKQPNGGSPFRVGKAGEQLLFARARHECDSIVQSDAVPRQRGKLASIVVVAITGFDQLFLHEKAQAAADAGFVQADDFADAAQP